MQLTPGTRLNHYEIIAQIGAGGMGVVYKAKDLRLDRSVAIKVLPQEKVSDPERRHRFVREAKAASALNHPNIITVHEISSADGADYIVMELVSGKSLDHLIPKRGLRIADFLKYAVQLADALSAAHGAGIIHRDLKPANVMVTEAGLVKVLDFGLAKLAERDDAAYPDETVTVAEAAPKTADGIVAGTASYMSPEQAQGLKLDVRSDIFSLGAMLYEMLTGEKAFQGDTPMSTLASVLNKEPEPLSAAATDCPRELERVISRCLKKDPAKRFQTMADLKVALEELKEESDSGSLVASPPPRRSKRWAVWAGAGTLLIATMIGVFFWGLGQVPSRPVPNVRRLTSDSGLTSFPAISPDGKFIAYASDRSGTGILDIWAQPVAGGDPVQLTKCKSHCLSPTFSPDGSRIAFLGSEAGRWIYSVSVLGGEPKRIADVSSIVGTCIRYSPVEDRIAYIAGGQKDKAVHVMDDKGGEAPKRLSLQGGQVLLEKLAWTPDGKGVMAFWFSADSRGLSDWYTFPLDGSEPTKSGLMQALADSRVLVGGTAPEAWGPKGLLLTVQEQEGQRYLAEVPMRGWQVSGKPARLTLGTGADSGTSMSADGRRMVFVGMTTTAAGVWTVPLDVAAGKTTGPMRQLTKGLRTDTTPMPFPDGKQVVFAAATETNPDLWIVDVVSGKEKRLSESQRREDHPIVSSNGELVAYRIGQGNRNSINLIPAKGGASRRLCEDCGYPYAFSSDGKKVFVDHVSPGSREIRVVDVATGQSRVLLRHADHQIFVPRLSPDEKWVAFLAHMGERRRRIYVAPMRAEGEIPEREWILVLDSNHLDRQPFWPQKGDLLYFLSERDDFRCIWAQRLDAKTRRPLGDPFAVQHLHDIRHSATPFADPSDIGLSIARDAMFFSLMEARGNVWLAEFLGK